MTKKFKADKEIGSLQDKTSDKTLLLFIFFKIYTQTN